jgi:hypothetical protein
MFISLSIFESQSALSTSSASNPLVDAALVA